MFSPCIHELKQLGISQDDAIDLRRIAMTLHRWHELECGTGNNYASWCLSRGGWNHGVNADGSKFREFYYDDENGKPLVQVATLGL